MIEGGNHSQFGVCGFQPGDRSAIIDRDQQQAETT
ncbi:MAG: alpha/beta hydrolase [Opitutaceae bacterium]